MPSCFFISSLAMGSMSYMVLHTLFDSAGIHLHRACGSNRLIYDKTCRDISSSEYNIVLLRASLFRVIVSVLIWARVENMLSFSGYFRHISFLFILLYVFSNCLMIYETDRYIIELKNWSFVDCISNYGSNGVAASVTKTRLLSSFSEIHINMRDSLH